MEYGASLILSQAQVVYGLRCIVNAGCLDRIRAKRPEEIGIGMMALVAFREEGLVKRCRDGRWFITEKGMLWLTQHESLG